MRSLLAILISISAAAAQDAPPVPADQLVWTPDCRRIALDRVTPVGREFRVTIPNLDILLAEHEVTPTTWPYDAVICYLGPIGYHLWVSQEMWDSRWTK